MKNFFPRIIFKSKAAMTLTELLVASILIGIVMLGVVSFNVGITQLQQSTSRSTIIAMRSKSAMAMLSRDALAAVGDRADEGVVTNSGPSHRSVCFRHDTNNPSTYADDAWYCYYRDNTRKLWHCNNPIPTASIPVNNITKCNNGGASDFLIDLTSNDFYTIVRDGSNRIQHITLSIASIFDPATAADPIKNPTYTVETRVSPPAHSR